MVLLVIVAVMVGVPVVVMTKEGPSVVVVLHFIVTEALFMVTFF